MMRIARARGFALALALAAPTALRAQPGFPPNDPDSWRVAGTAKILCSALFVSGRDSAEARAHVTRYFLGNKLDSLTKFRSIATRKLVRLTLANRITREAKLYGDQGCIIHQPGRDSRLLQAGSRHDALPDAATTPWPMGDVLPDDAAPRRDRHRQAAARRSTRPSPIPSGLTAGVRRRAQRSHRRRALRARREQGHAARELVDGEEHRRHAHRPARPAGRVQARGSRPGSRVAASA